jgi:RNA polymerase sigma-70 factor (ECF subfamily)
MTETRDDADAALVRSIAAGDESALARAYEAHGGIVYGLALRVLADPAQAEEVAQDVFLRLWRFAPRFDASRGGLRAWVSTIARNRAVDALRARRGRVRTTPDVDPADVAGTGAAPAERLGLADARALAVAAMDGLPAEERRVVELAYFEGFSQSEIAERTGTPLGTVKGRARSALARLRRALPRSLGGDR